jgi:hypothetical protein
MGCGVRSQLAACARQNGLQRIDSSSAAQQFYDLLRSIAPPRAGPSWGSGWEKLPSRKRGSGCSGGCCTRLRPSDCVLLPRLLLWVLLQQQWQLLPG